MAQSAVFVGVRGLPSAAMVTSIFGMVWLEQGISAVPSLQTYGGFAIVPGLILLGFSIRALRGGRTALNSVSADPAKSNRGASTTRSYVTIVVAEFALIFAAATLLSREGLVWASLPTISLIVGLHFFPLARVIKRRSMEAVGAVISIWSIAVLLGFPETTEYQWFAAGVGAGLV